MEYRLNGLNELSEDLHNFELKMGFSDPNIPQRMMLINSELVEAFEAYRKDKFCNTKAFKFDCIVMDGTELFKKQFEESVKDTFEDELADTLIRLLAFCAENKVDIEYHLEQKMKYNELRGYKYGGKKF
jgi:NTP pyrophosphatase (non-canonical NTP hydrolase)